MRRCTVSGEVRDAEPEGCYAGEKDRRNGRTKCPPGAKCRVCGCVIGTGRALTLQTGGRIVQPRGCYRCAGKCNKKIYFNSDQLKEIIKTCNKRLKGGVRGFVNSFIELWHKQNNKKPKKKNKKPKKKNKKPKKKNKKPRGK